MTAFSGGESNSIPFWTVTRLNDPLPGEGAQASGRGEGPWTRSRLFNLSSESLNESHLCVLNRGLSLVPTNHIRDFDVREVDLLKFFRSMSLTEFFKQNRSTSEQLEYDHFQPSCSI